MGKDSKLLSVEQLAQILCVSEKTIKQLIRSEQFTCEYIKRKPFFNLETVKSILRKMDAVSKVKRQFESNPHLIIRAELYREFPMELEALKLIDAELNTKREVRGFSLIPRETKKCGKVYYVRYLHDGKYLPSKWTTNTGDKTLAEKFAVENRDRLIGAYIKSHNEKAFDLLEKYYEKD
jgi:hypothetical protein